VTARPGNTAVELLRFTRTKTLCQLLELRRKDGTTVYVTDHDRRLTVGDATYRPILLGEMSAERREAALRSGDQDATGVVDGTYFTVQDLDAGRWTGTEVRQRVVDWSQPWVTVAAHRKWIRRIKRTGSMWTATLEGRTQQLQRPSAGRFGGTFSPKCPYTLGDPLTCKADISEWTQVNSIVTSTSTSATAMTLVDTGETWTTDQLAGYFVQIYGGPGSGQLRRIVSNTAHVLTIDRPWDTIPSGGDYRVGLGPSVDTIYSDRSDFLMDLSQFSVGSLVAVDDAYKDGAVQWTTGANAGTTSAIARYVGATRRIKLLLPTPFPIEVGDRGIVKVGCDGLRGTCKDKFDNVLNHGGDPYAPSAQQLIDPPEEA
jgi:uncharacterized phage protein (TIGR02218 family)